MDRRSWLWRRKSLEKSPGESESSGSVSSYSERYSDEQEGFRSSPAESSPNHAQSPEVSSINQDSEGRETVKSLTGKLSAALLDITAKEDLVKQHAKVAEEAVSGWETAEVEVSTLKQQLEASSQKNSVLEDRISQLNEALKECARQLRQSREEEQEQQAQDALIKTHECKSNKSELEKQLKEPYAQLETAKNETFISTDSSLYSRLESLEKENVYLKTELLAQSEQLRICTLEIELSNQTAESASKQHLESIKKVAKLESECRRLQAVERRTSKRYQRPISSTVSTENLTDSQSDSLELLPGMGNEQECMNSWASALVAEHDQFKHEKACARDITSLTEIGLMDDFLEMERLVALPTTDSEIFTNNLKHKLVIDFAGEELLRNELKALQLQVAELDKKIEKMESEKTQLQMALAETQNQHEDSCNQLTLAGDKLVDLQRQLGLANELKQAAMAEASAVDAERKEMESQLEMAHLEVLTLCEKVELLQEKLGKILSADLEGKIDTLEAIRKELQSQLNSAYVQTEELHKQVDWLEGKLEEERELCAGYLTMVKADEETRKELEIQLKLSNSELEKLNKSIASLELELQEERLLSAKLVANEEASESARNSLESQLELSHTEAGRLHKEMRQLQEEVYNERALATEYTGKCRILEEELSWRKKEAESWCAASSNGVMKLNKEKELAEAAGKLAECQKTIASLGQQLKLLTNIDEFMLEAEKPETDGCLPYFSFSETKTLHPDCSSEYTVCPSIPNGKEIGLPPASSSNRKKCAVVNH